VHAATIINTIVKGFVKTLHLLKETVRHKGLFVHHIWAVHTYVFW